MSKLMLVVSAELKNIVILQPEDGSDDKKINYYFKLECEHYGWVCENEAYVSINVKEKPTGNRRNDNLNLSRNMGNMIVDLLLFNCDGLLLVEYSFNGGCRKIHVDLAMGEYTDVIDGVEVSISKLKAKFVPYWG
ncbi:hypothetical protein PVL29_002420 [Vitis rotundifolia]|uniref:Uncharacterized protein n=1 Tax=Vitis rotundifolia TaxID=103349 RepID=A0AA39E5K5_VITRO|nr:hypothetical protein PVL29_002420 [Vitis rotundifolia]